MIGDILSNAGHNVVTAVDGADGVEKFKKDSSFEVVITDLAMPKLNGLQLARVCKTLRPSVPVVMLTARGEEIDRVVGCSSTSATSATPTPRRSSTSRSGP